MTFLCYIPIMQIIFQNEDFLVLNKPSGISVHPAEKNTVEKTVVDFLLEKKLVMPDIGEPIVLKAKSKQQEAIIPRPGIVHRLDKETSGILLVARTQAAYEFFKNEWQNRRVEKTYHAFLYGWPKEAGGKIDLPIGRSKSDIRMWATGRGARGGLREAETFWKVLGYYSRSGKNFEGRGSTKEGDAAYAELHPTTGRTHQIRVHMKSMNHPVVCDSLYASNRASLLHFKRLALHASSISINTPSGKKMTFEAPLPEDFQNALKMLEK